MKKGVREKRVRECLHRARNRSQKIEAEKRKMRVNWELYLAFTFFCFGLRVKSKIVSSFSGFVLLVEESINRVKCYRVLHGKYGLMLSNLMDEN